MKFLVLALCVCAASAASFGAGAYKPGAYNPGAFNQGAYNQGAYNPSAFRVGAYDSFRNYNQVAGQAPQFAAQAVASVSNVAPAVETVAPVAAAVATRVATPVQTPVAAPVETKVVTPVVAKAAQQVVPKTYTKESEAQVLRFQADVAPASYNYGFETSNGIIVNANGVVKTVGDSEVLVSEGSYQFVSDDGTPVFIRYTADENGYHPEGDSIPVAPEIPEAIARSLAYTASVRKQAPEVERF